MNHNATTLAGSTALSPACSDAELIATCAAFCDLERAYDATGFAHEAGSPEDIAADNERDRIAAESNVLAERMCALPCTTLAGVQAMGAALAAFDRELLKDGPAKDLGEVITSNMVERLLALQHPDASRMIGGPLPVVDADLLALRPEFDRLHGLVVEYNKKPTPVGGTECADFDDLCNRIATSEPAVGSDGRAFQAAAAMHDLYYRLSNCEQARDPVWRMLKGIAGSVYQSVEAQP